MQIYPFYSRISSIVIRWILPSYLMHILRETRGVFAICMSLFKLCVFDVPKSLYNVYILLHSIFMHRRLHYSICPFYMGVSRRIIKLFTKRIFRSFITQERIGPCNLALLYHDLFTVFGAWLTSTERKSYTDI